MLALVLALTGIGLAPLAMGQNTMKSMKPIKSMDTMKTMKPMKPMSGMMGMKAVEGPKVPPVTGYSDGAVILFIHTETSDPKIAKILTDMMGGSPVLVVPALAQAPAERLAPVYVFTNGHKGNGAMGPLGGQPDIFQYHLGEAGYRPLRKVTLVTWKMEMSAQVLKSVAELQAAIDNG
ncbi:MAG: hypothetical protein VCE74_21355, partial [Alphaproteobacteria bacterium]